MGMITVQAMTAAATLQDLGRVGLRSDGIGVGGAMDVWALQIGNASVGNALGNVAIEVPLEGITLAFAKETNICLTGAVYQADLDGKPVYHMTPITVKQGQILTLHRAVYGMYGYVCVAGLMASQVLGSAGTASFGEVGRLSSGSTLQVVSKVSAKPNDTLVDKIAKVPTFYESCSNQEGIYDVSDCLAMTKSDITYIRIAPNSEYEAFTDKAICAMTQNVWRLSPSSNRMGYRFERMDKNTPILELITQKQMNSHGVGKGMIQVPPQGIPIVLMADSQTTGGYPKIATVINADIGRLSQVRFGGQVRFIWTDWREAIAAYERRTAYIATLMTNDKISH